MFNDAEYLRLKAESPGCILMVRSGDFYEQFFGDAQLMARECGLTLMHRDRLSLNPVQMTGFPYHQLEFYIRRLVSRGHRVAVCEMVK